MTIIYYLHNKSEQLSGMTIPKYNEKLLYFAFNAKE